jgi:hypothetical protein
MSFHETLLSMVLSINVLLVLTIQKPALADSVYAIPNHDEKLLKVYDILENGQLEERADYDLTYWGPGDVTIDTQSNILFVTFEGLDLVELINARTFLSEGKKVAEGAENLAGVVFSYINPNDPRVFTVDRGTAKLFEYDWDAANKELTLLPPNGYFDPNYPDDPNFPPFHTLLSEDPDDPDDPNDLGPITAFGLALDDDGILYVSQYSRIVHAYDTADGFRHVRMIDLGQHDGQNNVAMDIDVDSDNGWLYAGGYDSHDNLIRFDLNDPNGIHVQDDIGAGVIGLAVSPGTSYLYATTYTPHPNGQNYELQAWNTNMPLIGGWYKIDVEPAGSPSSSGGAGVCVADVDYVPPFSVGKVDDMGDGCVIPRSGGEEVCAGSFARGVEAARADSLRKSRLFMTGLLSGVI